MKSISIFVILLFSQLTTSQTYILDSSFGNNGQIQYDNSSFQPSSVILCDNYYYYCSYNKVIKTNDTGQLQNNFGLNSILTFPSLPSNQYLSLKKLIYMNNAFYAYGYISYSINSITSDDIIIYKFDESGILDSTFGIDGGARINLGAKESVSSIIVKTDGSIYCTGTRANKIVYFKLTAQGILDYNFDTNGYKTITNYANSSYGYLIPYENGDYLLIGRYYDINLYGFLFITKVNENGVVDTSFGNNGYKTSELAGGIAGHTIFDVQFYQNKLYVRYQLSLHNYSTSHLKIFDLNTDQSIYDQSQGYVFDYIVKSDGIYIAQGIYCGIPCTGAFTLSKLNLNGDLSTSFHINGIYTYNFPNETGVGPVNGVLRCLQVNDSGEILLSGWSSAISNYIRKFASIRITQGALELSELNSSDFSIHPNPFNTEVSIKTQGEISNLKIYNLNGVEVCEPEIKNIDGTITLDLTPLKSSGVYILKFYSDNTQIIKKLIKY